MNTQKLYLTMKTYFAVGLTTLCLTSFTASAAGHNHQADERGHNKAHYGQAHKQMKKRFHMMAKKLDLSKEQRQEIKGIFLAMKSEKKIQRDNMSGFKEQVKTLILADEFDEAQFNIAYASYQDNFQYMAMEKAKMRHAVMQILTAEQKEKFLSMREQRRTLF